MPTFCRAERLKSEKTIAQLFKKGKSFSAYPLRLVYLEATEPLSINDQTDDISTKTTVEIFPIQFSLSVSKRNFKRAVDRNVLRRRIREAYRLHKSKFYKLLETNDLQLQRRFAFMVIYTGKEILPYAEIEKGILKMLAKFKLVNG